MNEKDIYALIGKSMDDKIKLDFDDVKSRIAKLGYKESAVITPIAPSKKKSRTVFVVIAAAAACLVCIFGLTVVISAMGGMIGTKSEASLEAYMRYDSAAYDDAALFSVTADCEAAEEPECYAEEDNDAVYGDTLTDSTTCAGVDIGLSDSDISDSDILSDSDISE